MLGDDVVDGTKRGIGIVGNAVRNAVKGALILGAIAGAAILIAGAVGVLGEGLGVASLGGMVMGKVGVEALAVAKGAAILGAAVMGITSLIPGHEEGFSLRKLFHRSPKKAHEQSRAQQQEVYQAPVSSARNEAPATRYETIRTEPVRTERYETIYRDAPAAAPAPACPPHQVIIDNSQRTQHITTDAPTVNYRTDKVNQESNNVTYTADSPQVALAANAAQPEQKVNGLAPDNPYFKEGKGAEMMRKGDTREAALAK